MKEVGAAHNWLIGANASSGRNAAVSLHPVQTVFGFLKRQRTIFSFGPAFRITWSILISFSLQRETWAACLALACQHEETTPPTSSLQGLRIAKPGTGDSEQITLFKIKISISSPLRTS